MDVKNQNIRIKILVDRLLKSDELAFTQLFNEFWEPNYKYALLLVRKKDVAEDIVQNSWIQIWQKRDSFSNENFQGYLYACLKNGCFKYLRDNKLEQIHEDVLNNLQISSDVESHSNLDDLQKKIESHIKKLQPRCQEVFRLSKVDDLTNDEIAEKLKVSKKTVQNHLSFALQSLQQSLQIFALLTTLF